MNLTIHILSRFLPQHTAGIEVYVQRLCLNNTTENCVLISGERNEKYEYNGISVFVIKEDFDFNYQLTDLIIKNGIKCAHYHQFEDGELYELKTLNLLKKLNVHTKFTFHLVQYYCSTLTLKQDNKKSCKIKAEQQACLKCYLNTNYLLKVPKIFGSAIFFDLLKPIPRINRIIQSCNDVVRNNIDRFYLIMNQFDELIAINPEFFNLLYQFEEFCSKLKYLPQKSYSIDSLRNRNESKLRLVFLGRIEESKGIVNLVNLAVALDNPKIEIDLFGQINDSRFNFDYFNSLLGKTRTKIIYKGVLSPFEVENILKNYDYLIHPSKIAEMTPLVIQESFKSNTPVIGNDIFGINTYVSNGVNGWLIDFEKIEDSIKTITAILNNNKILIQKNNP